MNGYHRFGWVDIVRFLHYDLSDAITVQRETQALQKLSTVVPLERMLIITRDEERTFALSSGQTIEAIPVWKWLID